MICKACDKAQEEGSVLSVFFRWKNANVELRGCDEHLTEIRDALKCAALAEEGKP